MPEQSITITVELSDAEAWQYAQFLKRVGHSDYRANATSTGEAYTMLYAGEKIRDALRAAGYNPR